MLTATSPVLAFAHNEVANPVLHAALDLLTLALITAPLWVAYLWIARRRATRHHQR